MKVAHLVQARSRAAFTIIEVIVALAILLIGMSSILGLLSFGAAMSRAASLRTSAASSIEAVVADLEESFFPLTRDATSGDWQVGEPLAIEGRPLPNKPGVTYSARAKPDPEESQRAGGPLRYDVEVEMNWTAGGRSRAKVFHVLLLREVPFGERLRREFVQAKADAPSAALPEKKKP
jgi:prepilin-type N-terminal cleavage/methylation domain-containing protein